MTKSDPVVKATRKMRRKRDGAIPFVNQAAREEVAQLLNSDGPASRRLTFRLTETEYDQLTELRMALHQQSDGSTLRALVKLQHGAMRKAVSDIRKTIRDNPELRETLDPRQLRLFTGGKS
jgi:hypothetical protein